MKRSTIFMRFNLRKSYVVIFACIALTQVALFGGRTVALGGQYPADVVRATYLAANVGDYGEVEKHLSYERRRAIANAGGMAGEWSALTRMGSIQTLEILQESQEGEGATVVFRLHFKDGSTVEEKEGLVKQESREADLEERWKLFVR